MRARFGERFDDGHEPGFPGEPCCACGGGSLDALGKTRGQPPVDSVERDKARLRAQVAKLKAELDTSRG